MKLFNRKPDHMDTDTLADEIALVRRVMAQSSEPRHLVFAAPTRCPECAEFGLVDEVSLVATCNHCYLCDTQWVITRRALNAVAAEGLTPVATGGVLFDAGTSPRAAAEAPTPVPATTDDHADEEPAGGGFRRRRPTRSLPAAMRTTGSFTLTTRTGWQTA